MTGSVWSEITADISAKNIAKRILTNRMTLVDPIERENFERFGASKVSVFTIFPVFLVYISTFVYTLLMQLFHSSNLNSKLYPLLIIKGCTGLVCVPCVALLWYAKKHQNDAIKSKLAALSIKLIPLCESTMAIVSMIGNGLLTIVRVSNGACIDNHQTHTWLCNPGHESLMLTDDRTVILMIMPVLFAIVFKSLRFEAVCLSWLISVVCIGIAIGIGGATNSLFGYIVYVLFSLIILYENQRQDLILYFFVKQQETLLAENKKMAEDQQTELRHMIANVAHDLKTPLSALTNGFEMIADSMKQSVRAHKKQCGSCSCEFGQVATTTYETIGNLTNVSSLMLMTINRCVDYSKTSHGLKLQSRLETINLACALSAPIKCMRDLQTRIDIDLLPLPVEICSHIITDKQWLQENILCLLSNAVKYSNSGRVTISAREIPTHHPLIKGFLLAELKKTRAAAATEARKASAPGTLGTIATILTQPATLALAATGKATAETRKTATTPGVPAATSTATTPTVRQSALLSSRDRDDNGSDYSYLNVLEQNSISSHGRSPMSPKRVAPKSGGGQDKMPRSPKNLNKVYVCPESTVTRLASSMDNRPLLLFEVEDTGVGLSDEVMANLFAPFKQADRIEGGTGLGLYCLAKRLEALGGYYGVQRRKDDKQGSLFWFAIPYTPEYSVVSNMIESVESLDSAHSPRPTVVLHSPPSPRSPRQAAVLVGNSAKTSCMGIDCVRAVTPVSTGDDTHAPVKPHSASQSTTPLLNVNVAVSTSPRGLHVLLVDDSVPILKMTTLLLKRQKYTVTQADNGAEALKMIAERKAMRDESGAPLPSFDVVLMDQNMPVMDGLEAARQIRAQEEADNVQPDDRMFIVGFSANSDHQTMSEAYTAGVDDFMTKPFVLQTFQDCYRKHINKRRNS